MADQLVYAQVRLPADPVNALDAATKQYVDTKIEIYVQEEPPGAGTVPLLWMDVDDLSMDPEGEGLAARGAPPAVQIYVSPEEPTDPEEGSLWVNTS